MKKDYASLTVDLTAHAQKQCDEARVARREEENNRRAADEDVSLVGQSPPLHS